jgi:hypothetical protein
MTHKSGEFHTVRPFSAWLYTEIALFCEFPEFAVARHHREPVSACRRRDNAIRWLRGGVSGRKAGLHEHMRRQFRHANWGMARSTSSQRCGE